MFPSLDREATVQAIRDLHEAVVKARNARGLSLRFAINKQDNHLDRIGTGYSRYFHNLQFEDVIKFCQFDVFHNDMFTVGSAVYRQKRGIAIGVLVVHKWQSQTFLWVNSADTLPIPPSPQMYTTYTPLTSPSTPSAMLTTLWA